jgi:hypothetical protein
MYLELCPQEITSKGLASSVHPQGSRDRIELLDNTCAAPSVTLQEVSLQEVSLKQRSKVKLESIHPLKISRNKSSPLSTPTPIDMASPPVSSGPPETFLSGKTGAGGKRTLLCALDASDHSTRALHFVLEKVVKPEQGDKLILFQAAQPVRSEGHWTWPVECELTFSCSFPNELPYFFVRAVEICIRNVS